MYLGKRLVCKEEFDNDFILREPGKITKHFTLGLCDMDGNACWVGGVQTATCPGPGNPGANCWMWTDGTAVRIGRNTLIHLVGLYYSLVWW